MDGVAPDHGPAGAGVTRSDDTVKASSRQDVLGAGASKAEPARTRLQTTLVVASLATALFLAALDITIVTVAVPTIAAQFRSTAGYTWIGSAYMLANASSTPVWGKMSDIWGRKPVLLLAVAVFWLGSLLSGLAVNMAMLIVARAVQGVGGGGIIVLVNICISDLFSIRKRGVYFGIMGIVWAVAGGIGPVVGGAFTEKVSWRWCFYINLPISGLGMAVLASALKLHNPRTPMRQGLAAVDWLGSLTIVGGTLMLLLGLELGGVSLPWASATVVCLLVFGLVTAAVFVVVEWRFAAFPVIPLRLFRDGRALASLGVCACHALVFMSASYYLPLYFQAVLGASPLLSGLYVLPFTLSLALASAATGILMKKTGQYLPCILFGMAVMTLGWGLLLDLKPGSGWAKLVLYQIVAGLGTGPNFQAPLIALQTTAEPGDMASATGTFGFVRQLFTAVAVVIGGVVFQNVMQRQQAELAHELGPDTASLMSGANAAASVEQIARLDGRAADLAHAAYASALRTMWIMFVAIAGLGLVMAGFVGRRKLSQEHREHRTGLQGMAGRQGRHNAASDEKATSPLTPTTPATPATPASRGSVVAEV